MTAPLHFITGLPGNGKSLFALKHIETRAKAEARQVYYYGIPELTLDWLPLEDPKLWYECPPGSIIVIDEAQKNGFPTRPTRQVPPKHIEEFQTLRHKGFDVYLITQHPNLIDPQLRDLAGQHFHLVRKFGMESANCYEWNRVVNPSTRSVFKDAQKHNFPYPKEVYSWYRSSELHTIKRKLPMQVYIIPLCLLIAALCVYGFRYSTSHFGHAADAKAQEESKGGEQAKPAGEDKSAPAAAEKKKTLTTDEYLDAHKERIAGFPATAPYYDGVMQPTQAPKPVACIATAKGDRCTCYTQQGTVMPSMPDPICKQIVRYGYFDDTQPVRTEAVAHSATQQPGQVAPQQPKPLPSQAAPQQAAQYVPQGTLALSQVTASMPANPAPNPM
ncbi:zonular occludens toxin domain-containing protein [Chitinimonas sp.]|uniref:zonular occludens toxin domain-containing protein n=1 Tax=Chitinimonas sp. TaxID=1934313 RepID=UPI002F93AA9E